MPTSVPGSRVLRRCSRHRAQGPGGSRLRGLQRGFTLIELLIVIAIMAVGAAVATWALPDGEATRLEEEGERLTALLEMARTESRVSGASVHWMPAGGAQPGLADNTDPATQFRFLGLPQSVHLPNHWLDSDTSAEIVGGGSTVLLGPEAILPAQRIVLRLGQHRIELASDGLGPFVAVAGTPP